MLFVLIGCSGNSAEEMSITTKEQDGMVLIPQAQVKLGPRHLSPVAGWTPPSDPQGITPQMGSGSNQRAAGGPPIPGSNGVGHVRP